MNDWYDDILGIIKECDDVLDEAKKKKVIRKGKLVKKTFCPPGRKAKKGKCVTMKATEKAKKKRGAKKGAIKRKGKFGKIKKKRAKAMKKRKMFGLK